MKRLRKCFPTLTDMKDQILQLLSPEHPWRNRIHYLAETDSTNTQAKRIALEGAPHGTVVIAGYQTGGRGRMGRSFASPKGQGVYMSVILRPRCTPDQLMHLTCATAVAMCQAVEKCVGIYPQVKWINDLVWQKRKLCGILTELVLAPDNFAAIVGIGINCTQEVQDFPDELQDMATSLSMVAGHPVEPAKVAACMIEAISQMDLDRKAEMLEAYIQNCITLGKDIALVRGEEVRHGHALSLDGDGGLLVRFPDGSVETVNSGDVSVRGLYGYL